VTLVLAGIGAYAEQTGFLNRSAPTAQPTGTVPLLPTDRIAETAPTASLAAATPTGESEESCVTCHTDQAILQAMAQDEPAAESLSSGEG
jgi:mono/diheme cytochrome c family protein